MRVSTWDFRSFDRGMTDAVLESECLSFPRQYMTILAPDCRDAVEPMVSFPGSFKRYFQAFRTGCHRGDHNVDISRSERCLPVLRTAFPVVPQRFRPGRHSLLELRWKALKRRLRHAERFQTLIAQRDTHPSIA